MNNTKMEQIVVELLKLQIYLQIYHWQTNSYSRHVGAGNLYTDIVDITDRIIESMQGNASKKIKMNKTFNIKITNISDTQIINLLKSYRAFIANSKKNKSTDVQNMFDELLEKINKTIYLFSLR